MQNAAMKMAAFWLLKAARCAQNAGDNLLPSGACAGHVFMYGCARSAGSKKPARKATGFLLSPEQKSGGPPNKDTPRTLATTYSPP